MIKDILLSIQARWWLTFGPRAKRVQARLVPNGNENGMRMHRLAVWCGGVVRVLNEGECGINRYVFLTFPDGREEQATEGYYIVKHPTEGFQVVAPVKWI